MPTKSGPRILFLPREGLGYSVVYLFPTAEGLWQIVDKKSNGDSDNDDDDLEEDSVRKVSKSNEGNF